MQFFLSEPACGAAGAVERTIAPGELYAAVALSGFADGEDVTVVAIGPDGQERIRRTTSHDPVDPCVLLDLSPDGDVGLDPGPHEVQVRVGPQGELLAAVDVEVLPG